MTVFQILFHESQKSVFASTIEAAEKFLAEKGYERAGFWTNGEAKYAKYGNGSQFFQNVQRVQVAKLIEHELIA